jgi:HK97 family phage prohead protease
VFNKVAVIGNYFEEQIAPAAFAEALKTSDVRCLFNHDADHVFGRSTANTLELSEDHHGLRFVSHLLSFDASSYALARRIDRGDISGCSFSFTVEEDKWRLAQRPGQLDQRIILKIGQLYDVGPVTYPAYPQTSVEAIFEKLPARSTAASDDDYDWQDDGYRGTVIDKARQRRLDEQLAALEQRDRARRPVSPARMHYLMSRLTAVQQRQDRTRERVDRLRKLAIGPVRELAANW